MDFHKLLSSEAQLTHLSKEELENIMGGGENLFYDAGVAVGRGIVRAFRWWESYCNEHADNIAAIY